MTVVVPHLATGMSAAAVDSALRQRLAQLIRESAKENKCNSEVLYKNTLKTNFIALMEMELYLRSRYGGQLKGSSQFDAVRQSIELFIESPDKQFQHEYYW